LPHISPRGGGWWGYILIGALLLPINNQGNIPWIIPQCYCWKGGMAKLNGKAITTLSVSYLT